MHLLRLLDGHRGRRVGCLRFRRLLGPVDARRLREGLGDGLTLNLIIRLDLGLGVRALATFGGVIRDSRRGPSHSFLPPPRTRRWPPRWPPPPPPLRLRSLRLGHLDRSRAKPSRFRRVRLAGRASVGVGFGSGWGTAEDRARCPRLGARAAAEEGGDARSRRNVGLARLGGFGLPRGDGGRRRAFAEDVREDFGLGSFDAVRRNGRRRGAPRSSPARTPRPRLCTIAVVHGWTSPRGGADRAGVVIVDGAHIVEPRGCGTEIESISAPGCLHRDRRRRDGLFIARRSPRTARSPPGTATSSRRVSPPSCAVPMRARGSHI